MDRDQMKDKYTLEQFYKMLNTLENEKMKTSNK